MSLLTEEANINNWRFRFLTAATRITEANEAEESVRSG